VTLRVLSVVENGRLQFAGLHHLVTSRCFITLPDSDAELASPHRIGMSLSFIGRTAPFTHVRSVV